MGEVGACGLIRNHVGIHVEGGGQIIGEQLAVETLKGRWITRLWVWVVILVRTGPQWCQEAERNRLSSLGWGWQRVREEVSPSTCRVRLKLWGRRAERETKQNPSGMNRTL